MARNIELLDTIKKNRKTISFQVPLVTIPSNLSLRKQLSLIKALITHNAVTSACKKEGGEWRHELYVVSGYNRNQNIVLTTISYNSVV